MTKSSVVEKKKDKGIPKNESKRWFCILHWRNFSSISKDYPASDARLTGLHGFFEQSLGMGVRYVKT